MLRAGNNVLVGGNISSQLSINLLRQVLQGWATNHSQDLQFQNGSSDDHVVDSLFGNASDNWLILGDGDLNLT